MDPVEQPSVLVIGISGVSSSGKTTLARLLRDVWPSSFILHEDDFYWPDSQIPVKNGVQDWDCLEAIDLDKLYRALLHIRQHASSPPDLESKEDQNAIGESGVSMAALQSLRQDAMQVSADSKLLRLAVIDGFLLFSQNMARIYDLLDVRLFLRTSYQTAKDRRENRSGYVTVEGFWEDPPGYVDDVVWPNYVQEHKFLFKQGDVEGEFDPDICRAINLHPVPREAEHDMTACLNWAHGIVREAVSANKTS